MGRSHHFLIGLLDRVIEIPNEVITSWKGSRVAHRGVNRPIPNAARMGQELIEAFGALMSTAVSMACVSPGKSSCISFGLSPKNRYTVLLAIEAQSQAKRWRSAASRSAEACARGSSAARSARTSKIVMPPGLEYCPRT